MQIKKVKKLIFSIIIASFFIPLFFSTNVFAAETDIESIPMALSTSTITEINDNSTQISESYDAIAEINLKTGTVTYLDSMPIFLSPTLTGTENNVYWKASVTISYTKSGDYVTLTNVSGSWTQLRGTSTLSNRQVNYGQAYTATNSENGAASLSSNTFSINTGFTRAGIIYSKTVVGANTSATVTTSLGSITLKAVADKHL